MCSVIDRPITCKSIADKLNKRKNMHKKICDMMFAIEYIESKIACKINKFSKLKNINNNHIQDDFNTYYKNTYYYIKTWYDILFLNMYSKYFLEDALGFMEYAGQFKHELETFMNKSYCGFKFSDNLSFLRINIP